MHNDIHYRYKHFTTPLLFQDLRFSKSALGPGDTLPEFDLLTTNGKRINSKDFIGTQPLLLITGSITCPMTASAIPSLKRLYSEFGERITFVMLNVREAHPGGNYPQPETYEEKLEHARAFQDLYEMPWLVAVDDIDGTLHLALDGKPNAAFVIGTDGKIVFRAHWARDERALRQALESVSQGDTPAKQQSRAMVIPVARAMGSVQPVMRVAGWQAQLDLLLAASPMAVAGLMATLFRPLAPDWRGIAAVISLGLLTVAEIASLLWWLL